MEVVGQESEKVVHIVAKRLEKNIISAASAVAGRLASTSGTVFPSSTGVGGGVFAAAASGLSGAAAIIATVSISGSEARSELKFIYVTYTRIHPITLQVYSGRTSGYGTAEELVAARGKQQVHLNNEGFESPSVDVSSESKSEIRGREQKLIDFYGGHKALVVLHVI